MKGDNTIIDILNELLAGELTAVDQYLIHGEMYADMGVISSVPSRRVSTLLPIFTVILLY